MSRFILAFICFFRLLFSGKLPLEAAPYLPPEAFPEPPKLPEGSGKAAKKPEDAAQGKADSGDTAQKKTDAKKPEAEAKKPEAEAKAERKAATAADNHREGALAFLALLQREGRLIDFLRESLDDYEDADIGASVRDIHRGCKKVLDEYLSIEAVMPGEEDDEVSVPKGFDPGEVRLIGDVRGEPPFQGVLRHHGWRVTKVSLPKLSDGVDRHVLAPAEVEIS